MAGARWCIRPAGATCPLEEHLYTHTAAPPRAGRREWLGLAVLVMPTLLLSMDFTILYLALPSISADLHPTGTQLLWIVDIYGFMIAGSLITMGKLGDRVGRRRVLMFGAAAFGGASIIAAFSSSAVMLIATRALLGVAGATLLPSTLSLIRNMFHDAGQRTRAIGVWMIGFSVGSAIGPLMGGLLLEHFWWGSAFLIGAPVMALLLIAAPLVLPEFKDPNAGGLDIVSAVLSLVGVLSVIYGVKGFAEHGAEVVPLAAVFGGLAVLAVFILRQRRLADPLVDLKLFQVPAYSASLATNTLAIFLSIGVLLFVAQYFQLVEGLSPLEAGLWMLPASAAFIVGALLAPTLVRWLRPAYVVGIGLAIGAVGLGVITRSTATSGIMPLVVGTFILDIGFSFVFTLSTDLIVGTAPPERAGAASAMSETGNELGGALGTAIIGSIAAAVYRREMLHSIPADLPAEPAAVARDTLGGAVEVASQLPPDVSAAFLAAANEAFAQGLQVAAWIGTLLALLTAALATIVLRNVRPHAEAAREVPQPSDTYQSGHGSRAVAVGEGD